MTSRTFGEWAVPRHLAFLSGVSEVFATSQASSATPDLPIVSAFLQSSIFEPHLLREILAFDDPTDIIVPHVGALVAILWPGSRWYAGVIDRYDDSTYQHQYYVRYFDGDKRWYEYERLEKGALYLFDGQAVRPGDLVALAWYSHSYGLGDSDQPGEENESDAKANAGVAERFGASRCDVGMVVSVGEDSAMVAMGAVKRPHSLGVGYGGYAQTAQDFVFTDAAEVREVALGRLWRAAYFPPAKVKAAEQD